MTFCDKIEEALNLSVGIYNLQGELMEGKAIGFEVTQDNININGKTYIKCRNVIIAVQGTVMQDVCNLIKITYELSIEKVVADFMQPLEYIIKNNVKNENIKGKYLGSNVLYIKSDFAITDILEDIYEGCAYDTVTDEEGVYLIKNMDDVDQEAEAIINGICLERGINVIIGSGRKVGGSYTIKDSAEHSKAAYSLAHVLGLKEGFYHIDKMIMYGLIYSIDKSKIDFYMHGGYAGFADVVRDKELIDTAEELFRCHLNISEASRRLYLHRNTLLYRIEKIKNLTGIDIKKFEEAVIFRTIISVYKFKGI
jgi:hypothetical protein